MKTKSIPVLFALLSLLFAGCGLSNAKDPSANNGSTEEAATEAELNGDANRSVNGHKFIDLALPSGTLWAETNIGAKTAADDGDFFAWGETQAKEKYLWDTYKYGTAEAEVTKYNDADALKELGDADDAARVNWGAPCRMPTDAECEELIDKENCTWDLVSRTTSSGEKRFGYEVKSVRNGNSILLPACCNYIGKEENCGYISEFTCFWTRNADNFIGVPAFFNWIGEGESGRDRADRPKRCPKCNERAFKRISMKLVFRKGGKQCYHVVYTCKKCGHTEERDEESSYSTGSGGGRRSSGGGSRSSGGSFGGGHFGGGGAGSKF